jgi:hypothetical protein
MLAGSKAHSSNVLVVALESRDASELALEAAILIKVPQLDEVVLCTR